MKKSSKQITTIKFCTDIIWDMSYNCCVMMSHHLTIRHETSEERTLLSVPHLAEVVAKVKQSRDIIVAMVSLCLRCQRNDNSKICQSSVVNHKEIDHKVHLQFNAESKVIFVARWWIKLSLYCLKTPLAQWLQYYDRCEESTVRQESLHNVKLTGRSTASMRDSFQSVIAEVIYIHSHCEWRRAK